jgi:cardiolipin synthase
MPSAVEAMHTARVRLYVDGIQSLAALEGLIDQASCRIDVLMFQWENDGVGAAIADRLAAKAADGVCVRVLVDGGGNLCFGNPDDGAQNDVNGVVRQLASKSGVEVIRNRNPFARFDHRKLVVVDGRCAWTGGRNFLERAFYEQHDVTFTMEGPLVSDLQSEFERSWSEQGGQPATPLWHGGAQACAAPANAQGRIVHTEPGDAQIQKAVYAAADRAQHHLYLENFTLADSCLLYKLAQARRRGVDVRVVLTINSNTAMINHTNRVTANRLLRAGVRVFLYPQMTHAKAAAMDDCWAYVGTANFDPLSFRRNHELGLVVCSCPLVHDIEEQLFLPDFCPEWELKQPLAISPRDCLDELLSSLCL